MAQIMGPLANQLFQLGTQQGGGSNLQAYQAPQVNSHVEYAKFQPPPEKKSGGSGAQAGALANIAGMAASAYMGSQSGAAPTSEAGNGFGLGGNIASGEVGSAEYAGTQQATPASIFSTPEVAAPVDNGYRSSNPYAADYGQMQTQKPSIFTYGGSYGGATY